MAYIEPNTEVRFLHGVPLDPDYENTLYFDNKDQQTNYFINKTKHTFSNQTYQRKSRGWLRVGFPADVYGGSVIRDLYNSTYMMFKNTNYENKWFYAFVDKVEYVNNNTVDVQYHIDVMQTWHFDYTFNQCFIERQHTTSDAFGANTIPEQLETGPYIGDRPPYLNILGQSILGGDYKYRPGVLVATSFDPDTFDFKDGIVLPGWGEMGGYYSGVWLRAYDISIAAHITALNAFLKRAYEDEAVGNGVLSMAMIPFSLITPDGTDYASTDILFEMPTSLGSYTPRNKKLLTDPYNFLYATNNQGQTGEYQWENSTNPSHHIAFRIWANYAVTPGMLCAPVEYKLPNQRGNYDEMLTANNFPLCAWTNDAFKAWLAQNAGSIIANGASLALGWISAITNPVRAASGFAGGALSYANTGGILGQTLNAAGQLFDHARRPPQTSGNGNGNLIYQASLMTFSFYRKYIKPEYARIIDAYFDMYGYAVHTVGTPNRAARRCYTFVKTVGCSLNGDMPSEDILAIQNLFNRGIRFWRHTAVFGNYDPSVNNNQL